ncbi:MAG: hypothetical protein ACR2RE_18250 [Geminicoccaceae bacterium]
MIDDPTIKDLFRVINEMRADMATKDDVKRLDKRFDKVDGELNAIRNVVDNDLASYEQVLTLEGKMTDVQKTVRQHGKILKERA